MGIVYLIHFDQPLKHAKHYLGFCNDGNLHDRLERHRAGNGSKLMAAIKRAKFSWQLVRTWENVDRNFERRLKNQNNAAKYCPVCRGTRPQLDLKTEAVVPTQG